MRPPPTAGRDVQLLRTRMIVASCGRKNEKYIEYDDEFSGIVGYGLGLPVRQTLKTPLLEGGGLRNQ